MRKITTVNRWQLAVYWLSAAFLITLFALAAGAYCIRHEKQREEEQAALLFASDLLALRDSLAAGDGREEICRALLESRIPHLVDRLQAERLAAALKTNRLNELADRTEQAILTGEFSAEILRRMIGEVLPEETAPQNETQSAAALPSFGETDAVSAARTLLGLRFQKSASGTQKTAYCRNAVSVFDSRGASLRAYSVYASVKEAAVREDQCLKNAVCFVRSRQGMHIRQITESWEENGVRYILFDCGGEEALTGVRRDSGGICFFLRTSKKTGNVLQ